jgi:NADPH:quinone reductase-like Zn-dependent oxidoreductase
MIVNAESAVKAPDALSDEEASTLPIAAVTARFSLMDYGNLPPGQTVLLQGTGVVSIFAVQIASAYGARVIATSSRDENLLKVKALGAWEGITYKQNPAWEKRALELTDGKGVDFQFEVVETFQNEDGSRVASRWRVTGKNNGALGTAADQRRKAFTGTAVWAVRQDGNTL